MGRKRDITERVLKVHLRREINELDEEESELVFEVLRTKQKPKTETTDDENASITVFSEHTEINLYIGREKGLWQRLKNWLGGKFRRKEGKLPKAKAKKKPKQE